MTASTHNLPGSAGHARGQLLLVEGDVAVRESLRAALESEGFAVGVADLGPAAVHRYAAGLFDLVLLDASRPGREAWDLMGQLRAVNPDVGVVVLTVRTDLRAAAVSAGALAVCEKPMAVASLVEVLAGLLGAPHPARPEPSPAAMPAPG